MEVVNFVGLIIKFLKPMFSVFKQRLNKLEKFTVEVKPTRLLSQDNNTVPVRRTVSEKINSFFMNPQREGRNHP